MTKLGSITKAASAFKAAGSSGSKPAKFSTNAKPASSPRPTSQTGLQPNPSARSQSPARSLPLAPQSAQPQPQVHPRPSVPLPAQLEPQFYPQPTAPLPAQLAPPTTQSGTPQANVHVDYLELAKYATQHALQPVSADKAKESLFEDMGRLRAATDTVNETRKHLPWRGNVLPDLEKSELDSGRYAKAGRDMGNERRDRELADPNSTPVKRTTNAVALAAAAGAGNCGEFSDAAVRLHANKLENRRTVEKMANEPLDHAWAVESGAAGTKEQNIVIDPWMRGPAILQGDARPVHQPSTQSEIVEGPFYRREGQDLLNSYNNAVSDAKRDKGGEIKSRVDAGKAAGDENLYLDDNHPEYEVTSKEFRQNAKMAARELNDYHKANLVAIPVVASARHLGTNFKGAANYVNELLPQIATEVIPEETNPNLFSLDPREPPNTTR